MNENNHWTIGSDPSCDMVIDRPQISARHCCLVQTAAGFLLEDLGSTNGTFVNGQRLSCRTTVLPTDRVTLGLTTPMPWPRSPDAAPPRVIRIGREPDNDVVLNYPAVSAYHARLVTSGDQPILEDLGSTNGTFVGSAGNPITRAVISPADMIYFGSFGVRATELLNGRRSEVRCVTARVEPPVVLENQARNNSPVVLDRARPPLLAIPHVVSIGCVVLVGLLGGAYFLFPRGSDNKNATQTETKPVVSTQTEVKPVVRDIQPPPVPSKVARPPSITAEELERRHGQSVVWLGVQVKDERFPVASGWLAKDNRVVTSARAMVEIKDVCKRSGADPFVCCGGRFWKIVNDYVHPQYQPGSTGDAASTQNNIAVALLESPAMVAALNARETSKLATGSWLCSLGFENRSGATSPYDPLTFTLRPKAGEVVGGEQTDNGICLIAKIAAPDASEGAPVFDGDGNLLGTLTFTENRRLVIPPSVSAPLLTKP